MEQNRVDGVLELLFPKLTMLTRLVYPQLAASLVESCFCMLLRAFKYVLLCGGVKRQFEARDWELFFQDLRVYCCAVLCEGCAMAPHVFSNFSMHAVQMIQAFFLGQGENSSPVPLEHEGIN